ncbi:hypothetical protein Tco_0910866 [Tanacetum coccineum]|uniref:Uncharacterized protein n=1 Tax=Tanacetum coccineum TaxID=301880 RepID=A0ABQ5CU52_9ASTR
MVVTVEVIGDDDFWHMAAIGSGDDGCCGGGDWIGEEMRDESLCVFNAGDIKRGLGWLGGGGGFGAAGGLWWIWVFCEIPFESGDFRLGMAITVYIAKAVESDGGYGRGYW